MREGDVNAVAPGDTMGARRAAGELETAVLAMLQAAGRPLSEVEALALSSRALTPYSTYAAHLLSRQIISVNEALLTLAE